LALFCSLCVIIIIDIIIIIIIIINYKYKPRFLKECPNSHFSTDLFDPIRIILCEHQEEHFDHKFPVFFLVFCM